VFKVYIDDSGTDPNQQVAIATALIVPAAQIVALDKEWATLRRKWNFTSFHMSECVARNPKFEFANWDDAKRKRVISRVRQIGKKFGVNTFSLAVKKSDYDELVVGHLEYADKYHYTWAMRAMLGLLDKWAQMSNMTSPLEYIYDWIDPKAQKQQKAEIDALMGQSEEMASEEGNAGQYLNYSFRRRQDVPALQCTDAIAWTCYQFALLAHEKQPLTPIAQENWDDYARHPKREWLNAAGMKREHLKDWVEKENADGRSRERFKLWNIAHPPKQ
jgi:Protein of unknown function (DUF3800)